jgi:MFS family permease
MLGSALNPVNSTLIATALAPIAATLHVSAGRTAVLVSALYLACAVAQPTAGRLSEELGPRRVFLTGIVLVLAGGLLGGFASDLTTLVVARVIIGIGTSAGYPSAMVLVRRRAAAAGLGSPPGGILAGLAIVGLALIAVGPPIGGVLVSSLGWRATFFINVPFALLAFGFAITNVPRDAVTGRHRRGEILSRIDIPGIALFGGTMTALLVFLLGLPRPHWVPAALTIVIGAALAWWELRARTPFFDVRALVSDIALTGTYVRTALTMLGAYVILYGLPQWLEDAHHLSAGEAGVLIIPMGIVSAAASTYISRRAYVRWPLIASGAAMTAGAAIMLFLASGTSVALVLLVTCVFGVALGASISGSQTALYLQAAPDQVGTAAGLLRTFTYLGSIAASTITGLVFSTRVDDAGLHSIAWIVGILGLVVVVITTADRTLRLRRT